MGDAAEKTGLQAFEARLAVLAEKVRVGFPERARELRTAAEALARDEGTAREDIRRYAHKIRGTAGSHGFARLSEIAATVEGLALRGPGETVIAEARALAEALEAQPALVAGDQVSPAPLTPDPVSGVQPRASTLAGLRIAAVDDDASTRRLLTLTLGNVGGAEAVLEEKGERLIERLRTERFDVVIVDAMMPGMNGLACLERIASDGLHREGMRFFVLSAATSRELSWALPPVLGVGWLRKPFRPRELVDALALELARDVAPR